MRGGERLGRLAWLMRSPIRPSWVASLVWAVSRQPPRRVLLSALVLLAAVALADAISGTSYSFSVFYLLVVVRVSATGREGYLIPTAVVTAVTWTVVEVVGLGLDAPWWPLIWNSSARFAVLAFTGLLVAAVVGMARVEREISRTDPLTGLLNRRGFYDTAELQVARAASSGTPLSAVFLDVDRFKAVNDEQGHAAGDRLLTEVAAALSSQLRRREDLLARLGGDEFVALLPDTDASAAAAVAQRAASALDAMTAAGDWPVGFSLGVITFEQPVASLDALLSEADRLMYVAKRRSTGRDASTVVTGVHPGSRAASPVAS